MSSNNERPASPARRTFLKVGAGVIVGAAAVASLVEPSLGRHVGNATGQENSSSVSTNSGTSASSTSSATSTPTQTSTLTSSTGSAVTSTSAQSSQASALQVTLDQVQALATLSVSEQSLLEAAVETIIPSDSNGPGAKEAGVLYFIDQQLNQQYGRSGNMFMDGPWVPANTAHSITVDGITYSGGTANVRQGAGTRLQYVWNMREFWRIGLEALQAYANAAYGGDFETLSASDQLTCLQDLWNNKPTAFNGIIPKDFAYELTWMTWAGFLMDPVYGGNRNMVGWQYVAFNGTNMGNFYGEGHTDQELMVATTPTRLQPASLGQFQKGSP